ncbi:hypothetical protein LCGC14_2885180, partial [marine sediment metagenome]
MTVEDIIQAAVERHKVLLAELCVLEKFLKDYGEAGASVPVVDNKLSDLDPAPQPPPIPDFLRRPVGNPLLHRWTKEEFATLEALWSRGVSAKHI